MAARAQKRGAISASFSAFDQALKSGLLPATGKVTDRLVRSAFASLERVDASLGVNNIPNPLPAPHNLTWYFGACSCPDDVRAFATMLGRKHIRVWSVARTRTGFSILVQVFGAATGQEAAATVELEARVPTTRLKHFVRKAVSPFKLQPANVEAFMHDYARTLLQTQGLGNFVEVTLDRKDP